MINKEKKDSKKTWKIFLLLPVSLLLILTFSCTEKPETINSLTDQAKGEAAYDTAYYNVDVMPVFPGDFQEIRRFVMQNIRYPEEAKKHAVAGKIFVQFVVDREGNIVTDAKKYKISGEETEIGEVVVVGYKPAEGTDGEGKEEYVQLLKDEAVRVISMLPSFDSPAQKDGKPVPVAFTFPINFALE